MGGRTCGCTKGVKGERVPWLRDVQFNRVPSPLGPSNRAPDVVCARRLRSEFSHVTLQHCGASCGWPHGGPLDRWPAGQMAACSWPPHTRCKKAKLLRMKRPPRLLDLEFVVLKCSVGRIVPDWWRCLTHAVAGVCDGCCAFEVAL